MKKMISKIALAVLAMNSMPIHASLGKSIQDGVRSTLQGIGDSSGSIAVYFGALMAITALSDGYQQCHEAKKAIPLMKRKDLSKMHPQDRKTHTYFLLVTATLASLAAGIGYGFAKTCGWVGSKI